MKRLLLPFVITLCASGLVRADPAIRSLQQTLKREGLYYGEITGEKSTETSTAIRRYQIRNGLKVTGEMNDETRRSIEASSNLVAAVARPTSKPPSAQVNSVRPAASSSVSPTSPPAYFRQPMRQLESNPSYAASFYQPAPPQVNRRTIAAAQYQLMRRGDYTGPIDGTYGPQTAFALRTFQWRAGVVPTGRFDLQTLNALGLSDRDPAYLAPASSQYEMSVPVRKSKEGRWIVKWKKYLRGWSNDGDRY